MAVQPITSYAQDTGQQETVFNRTDQNQADNRFTRHVFSRRGDSYTVNRANLIYGPPRARRTNNTNPQRGANNENDGSTSNLQLTREIRETADLYRKAGPRNIAEQTLFTSQTQSTNILTNLANTFGSFFNAQNTTARQSTATQNSEIQDFASLYLSAGPQLLNTGSLFSANSIFSNSSAMTQSIAPQITFLSSIQSYLSTGLSQNILGGGLNLLA